MTRRLPRLVCHAELLAFADHNLVTHSVSAEVDVVCGNVMICFAKELQDRVIGLFHDSLADGGRYGEDARSQRTPSGHGSTRRSLGRANRRLRRLHLLEKILLVKLPVCL
ncbi:MAG: CheR family methyltransferase [Planctomycetota bacterium]